MAEFRVVLDGLELNEKEHAVVARAVLAAGLKAVNSLGKAEAAEIATVAAPHFVLGEDWIINGGWILRDALAQQARELLQEQGVLPRELGQSLGH